MITNIKYYFNKLFLIKEIKSQKGELHFQRYRIIETKWFNIYIHYIAKSDEDEHMHDHPWDFISFILRGGYYEDSIQAFWQTKDTIDKIEYESIVVCALEYIKRQANIFHKITLIKPTWTLVFTGPRKRTWGYFVDHKWIDNITYRKLKHGSTNNIKNDITSDNVTTST